MRKHSVMIAIAAVTGCVILLSHGTSAQIASTKPMSKKWEYKVVHIKKLAGEAKDLDGIVTGLEASLNELGASGWEVCLEINGGVVLKRQRGRAGSIADSENETGRTGLAVRVLEALRPDGSALHALAYYIRDELPGPQGPGWVKCRPFGPENKRAFV